MVTPNTIGTGIVVYKNALPKEWDLANRLETSLTKEGSPFKWNGAKVGYSETNLDHRNCVDFKYRKETLGPINENSEDLALIHDQVNSSLKSCLVDYCKTYHIKIEWIGAFNMVKYGPGDKFNIHSDDGEPYRCTVSAVGYINDDYEGGELYFNYFNLTYKPEAGDLILFPSTYVYSHASLPVKTGVKYATVIMTDRSEFAHHHDSPVYHSVEEREKRGLSSS